MNMPLDSTQISQINHPSPAVYLHIAIAVDSEGIKTLGDETFRLVSFQGQESISSPFEFQLELHANTDFANPVVKLDFNQIIGKPVTFAVALPSQYHGDPKQTDLAASSGCFLRALHEGRDTQQFSWFHGMVTSFGMGIPGVYHITVKPALWRLTLANHYQVYRNGTVLDTIKAVLAQHKIRPVDSQQVDGLAVNRKQDWFQAGETDYDFFQRMLGKSHLYYYFRHAYNQHELVLSNNIMYPDKVQDRPLRYAYTGMQENGLEQDDVISDYRYQQTMSVSGVQSLFTRQDESWQVDGDPNLHRFDAIPADTSTMPLVFRQHKVYQYGSDTEEAEAFRKMTASTNLASDGQLSGESFCPLFRCGYTFTMTDDREDDPNPVPAYGQNVPIQPNLKHHRFVLTKVEHKASLDGGYQNTFEATTANALVAPFSMADTQQGSILAEVVAHNDPDWRPASWKYGSPGDFDPQTSTYTYSRDNQPQTLSAQGVYVRFATDLPDAPPTWVKLGASMESTPEVGAQVVVSRSNDESELPEIANIIHTSGNMTCTPSTWQSRTDVGSNYNTHYGDGINIGFGRGMNNTEAKQALKRAVGIVSAAYGLGAGYDQLSLSSSTPTGRFRDVSYSQGAGYSFSTANSTAASAQQSLALTYGGYGPTTDLLRVDESFGSSFSRSQGQVQSSRQNYDTSYSNSTFGTTTSYDTVNGTSYHNSTNNGMVTTISTINADSSSTTTQTGNSLDVRLTTGTTTSTNTVIGIATNNNNILTQINLNTTGVSSSTDLTGMSTVNSTTGVSTQNNMTLESTSSSIGLISTDLSLRDVSTSMSINGMNSQINIAAISNTINLVGMDNNINIKGPGFEFNDTAEAPDVNMKDMSIIINVTLEIHL